MPLIELKCEKCGYDGEELVKADGIYPPCPKCGGKLTQNYSGKLTVNGFKKGGCSGDCKHCSGCR